MSTTKVIEKALDAMENMVIMNGEIAKHIGADVDYEKCECIKAINNAREELSDE